MAWLDRLLGRAPRAANPDAGASDASATQPMLLEAFGPDGWRTVRLDVGPGRISDALNDADRELRLTYVEPDATDGANGPAEADLDDVFLLLPPEPSGGDPQRRLHRPAHPLWVRIGECAVTGSVHLPPGSVGTAYLLRRHPRFFVLTDASVQWPVPNGYEERRVPAVLVNLQHVTSLRDTPEPEAAPSAAGAGPGHGG